MCTVAAVLELPKLPYQRHVAEKLCAGILLRMNMDKNFRANVLI